MATAFFFAFLALFTAFFAFFTAFFTTFLVGFFFVDLDVEDLEEDEDLDFEDLDLDVEDLEDEDFEAFFFFSASFIFFFTFFCFASNSLYFCPIFLIPSFFTFGVTPFFRHIFSSLLRSFFLFKNVRDNFLSSAANSFLKALLALSVHFLSAFLASAAFFAAAFFAAAFFAAAFFAAAFFAAAFFAEEDDFFFFLPPLCSDETLPSLNTDLAAKAAEDIAPTAAAACQRPHEPSLTLSLSKLPS